MTKASFAHGGKEYDDKYPEGIPTSVKITLSNNKVLDSELIMFPSGHARNETADLKGILDHKFKLLGALALEKKDSDRMLDKLNNLDNLSNAELQTLYSCNIRYTNTSVDDENFK